MDIEEILRTLIKTGWYECATFSIKRDEVMFRKRYVITQGSQRTWCSNLTMVKWRLLELEVGNVRTEA